jgi:4-aminobutyrate aminotransferase/(S)-3-amino-2-methylpropionate transaminase
MGFSVPQQRKLVTELPGPNSVALQQRRVAAVSRGAGTLANIYMDHGAGAILVDVDGNQLIDLGCGIGVTTIGHAHPEVAEAAYAQAQKLTHTLFTVTPYENYVRVAEKLAAITPGDFEKHSILVNSGAEAVENAVKIARKHTGRRAIVSLDHAFHGRTNLTMAMTYRPWPERAGMGPFPGELYSVPISYPFRDGLSGEEAAAKTIDYIVTHIGARSSPSRSRATAASSSPPPATSRRSSSSAPRTASCSSPTRSRRASPAPAAGTRSSTTASCPTW